MKLVWVFFTVTTLVSAQICQLFPRTARFDCLPNVAPNEDECTAVRGCCWDADAGPAGPPKCYFPLFYGGYSSLNTTYSDTGLVTFLNRTFPSSYPSDANTLRLDVEYYSDTMVRVKIVDATRTRYETPYPQIKKGNPAPVENPMYKVSVGEGASGFAITTNDQKVM